MFRSAFIVKATTFFKELINLPLKLTVEKLVYAATMTNRLSEKDPRLLSLLRASQMFTGSNIEIAFILQIEDYLIVYYVGLIV